MNIIRNGPMNPWGPDARRVSDKPNCAGDLKKCMALTLGCLQLTWGRYRRFYRQIHSSLADAGDGAICGALTFAGSLSIRFHYIKFAEFFKSGIAAYKKHKSDTFSESISNIIN